MTTTMISNPGEAMRLVQAVLRQHGYSTDNVEATHTTGTGGLPAFRVVGDLQDLATGEGRGRFDAGVRESGMFSVLAAAFGRLTQDGIDPFFGL